MTQRIDAIRLLTEDHETVEQLFAKFEGTTDNDEKTRIAHEVVHELAVHGEIEELLFYPRVRTALSDGDTLADDAVSEHLDIKETLNEIDRRTADDDGFDQLMHNLMDEVRNHVEDEENELFPKVQERLRKDDLLDLGTNMRTAKSMVPTRPHPNAPTSPVGKLATAPPVVLVDRIRDAVRSAIEPG